MLSAIMSYTAMNTIKTIKLNSYIQIPPVPTLALKFVHTLTPTMNSKSELKISVISQDTYHSNRYHAYNIEFYFVIYGPQYFVILFQLLTSQPRSVDVFMCTSYATSLTIWYLYALFTMLSCLPPPTVWWIFSPQTIY